MTMRTATADTKLGGHPIAKGTHLVYSSYLMHRRADLFENPESFGPDRWLPDRAKSLPRGVYFPFGLGARKCIGEEFAPVQTTLVLAGIVARRRFVLRPAQGVRAHANVTLIMSGLRMRATERKPADESQVIP